MKNIIWLYKPYIKYGKILVILSIFFWLVLIPLNSILPIYFPQKIIDALESGNSFGEIIKITVFFSSILCFIPMYEDVFNMYYKNKTTEKIELNIKCDIYSQALKTDYKYIDDPKYYDDYVWALNEYANQSSEAHNLILNFIATLVTVTTIIGIVITTSPWLVILIILNIGLRMLTYFQTDKILLAKDEKIIPFDRKLNYFHRIFYLNNYAADLKSTNLKSYILAGYDENKNRKLAAIGKAGHKAVWWSLISDVIYRLSMALITLLIAYEIYNGRIATVGMYITLMLAVDKLDEHLFRFSDLIRSGKKISMYGGRIRKFFELESEIENESKNTDKISAEPNVFSVEFKDVKFRYDNSDFSITDFSLKINPGEKIAIVGENGAGKSTLVKLLLRLYDVTQGDILINSISIKKYDVHSLRKLIGVSFQSPNIYALSLIDNIELYNKSDDENSLRKLLHNLGINKIMEKNTANLSTEMTKEFDENGIVLSGGETQKVGLARIFNGDFGLILLDEPSSALDPIAEYEMNNLILSENNKSTTIIIAHRLSTVRYADKIILVDSGTIKENGTHDELMAAKGQYYNMFTKQAENYVE